MKILLWDLDWFYKQTSIPNVKCMKLSSYHKQKGDEVTLIKNEFDLSYNYDLMYIFKERKNTPSPERRYLDSKKSTLIGKGYFGFNVKDISTVVAACRPDYLLYEGNEFNKYTNANYISFYVGGQLVKRQQDYHNAETKKHYNIVSDKWFWKAEDNDIIYCLDSLKDDKNLMFLEPISLKKILCNNTIREKFLNLNFCAGTSFKWRNDFSSVEVDSVIQFMEELKSKTRSDIGFVPIKSTTEMDSIEQELLRCFQIIDKFKRNKTKCIIISGKETNKWYELLERWTRYSFKLSFIEFMLHPYCESSGVLWYNILNNSIHWRNAQIDFLLYLLTSKTWENYRHLLFTQWGTNELSGYNIDYAYIKENINLLYKDE